ncbi:hypothetical protein SAMN06265337_2679 [Hymenobacter gelipurpurascens]|uniref:Uncharacterized protein n=1 Tax=Hymenobacter gelipurpurascens TaxID=89968 RepID=A0A212UA74_9BACT|nr:hypothetical protein SAMN06265337_2679 [Hymenobacter gelipurpurascens]
MSNKQVAGINGNQVLLIGLRHFSVDNRFWYLIRLVGGRKFAGFYVLNIALHGIVH